MSEIKYATIGSRSITDVVQYGEKGEKARRLANKHDGSQWVVLSGFMENLLDFEVLKNMKTGDKKEDQKSVMKAIKLVLHPALANEIGIPEADISWSSNTKTMNACKYIGDMAKIILAGEKDTWLPGDNTCAPLNAMQALCKSPMSEIDKFELALTNASKCDIGENDIAVAISLLTTQLNKMLPTVKDQDTAKSVVAHIESFYPNFQVTMATAKGGK